eukprot:scaffold6029_cov63-Phaeocystis_antarctica.AAC.8
MRTLEPVVQIHAARAWVLLALLERALEHLRKTGHSLSARHRVGPAARMQAHLKLLARVDAVASMVQVVAVLFEHLEVLGVHAEHVADGLGSRVVQHL